MVSSKVFIRPGFNVVLSFRLHIIRNTASNKFGNNSRTQFSTSVKKATSTCINVGERPLQIETGHLAKMADGSAVGSVEGTSVLVTAVCKQRTTNFANFLPLTVDYRHKWSAAGRIPTNYHRRDLGPTEFEILTSRMIDRSVRPLFSKGFSNDVQLTCNALSLDGSNDPCVVAINATAAAISVSDIPWNGPVAAVRLAYVDGHCLVNPNRRETKSSRLNLVLAAATGKRVIMLDGDANDLPLSEFLRCVKTGLEYTEKINEQLLELKARCGKAEREGLNQLFLPDAEHIQAANLLAEMRLSEILTNFTYDKLSRDKAVSELRTEVMKQLKEKFVDVDPALLESAFSQVFSAVLRRQVFTTGQRCDGRSLTDLRPIKCEVGLYKPLHGSALFQRGQTQVLSTLTLDSVEASLRNDAVSVMLGALKEKMFMLSYEFPSYANNELGLSKLNRRELGHGALAEKALRPLMPDEFDFSARLACEVLESNGSSSMASVCAGSLALMDGGVPVKAPAAGVAIGLLGKVNEDNPTKLDDYRLLTDINGLEDYTGDMDFKVAGTENGLTAVQLDVKTMSGLSFDLLEEALLRAHKARVEVLAIMSSQALSHPRPSMKENGPAVAEFVVPMNKRYRIMKMGGYYLKRLESDFGVQISQIDEQTYKLFAPNKNILAEAKENIEELLERSDDATVDLEFNAIYNVKIVEILERGIMVTLSPSTEPVFIPNSQLDLRSVKHASALGFNVGDEIMVKYFGRDPANGKIRLSRKILMHTTPNKTHNLFQSGGESSSPWAKQSA